MTYQRKDDTIRPGGRQERGVGTNSFKKTSQNKKLNQQHFYDYLVGQGGKDDKRDPREGSDGDHKNKRNKREHRVT